MKIHIGNKDIEISKTYLILGILFILALILLLLKGSSSNNKLSCTLIQSNNTGNFKTIYRATFKKDKLETLVVEYTNEPTSDYLDMIDNIYDNYETQLINFKKAGGYNYSITKNKNSVYFKSTIQLKEIPDSTKELIGFNNDWSMKNFKKNLEDNDFKCN